MLNVGEYTIEILGIPSGQIIIFDKMGIEELKKNNLIKYKRHIIINDNKMSVHGYIFLDEDLELIKELNNYIY
jgi:hypothetical protein